MKRIAFAAAAIWAATIVSPAIGQAASSCSSRLTRDNVVQCALSASLVVEAARHELEAAEGRRLSVSPLLPSNPVLSLSAAQRTISGGLEAINWHASLAQEIEIAGQRGVRRDAAEAKVDAESRRVLISRRDVAVTAWLAFFDALAALEEQRLAATLTAAAQGVSLVARARADKGVIAPIDADVADAATVRVLHAKLDADRRLAGAESRLISLLGLDPAIRDVTVEGDLVPLAQVATATALLAPNVQSERLEVLALDAERKALELRANAYRRARIPNPTVSLYAENDGFNERVLGAGISFPIPMPGNVGRTYLGEIAEAEALARRAGTDRERLQREIRLEIAIAVQSYESRSTEVEAFTAERVGRAAESLRSLGQEVEAGRLSVREAVVAQQALVELLQANVAARRAWCLASVELARAAGVPLEGAAP